jgi:hydrogenase maturation protease
VIERNATTRDFPAAAAGAARLRVIGCGNPCGGDDSAGLEILRRLRERGEDAREFVSLAQAGVEVLHALEGAELVLFLDGVVSGEPPGTIHLLPLPSPRLESRALASLTSHGWGLTELLGLMAALGRRVPRIVLLGVELEGVAAGAARSPAVEAAIERVAEEFPALRRRVSDLLDRPEWKGESFAPGDPSFPGGW